MVEKNLSTSLLAVSIGGAVLPLIVVRALGHLGGHWKPWQCLWDKDTSLGLGFTLEGGREGRNNLV